MHVWAADSRTAFCSWYLCSAGVYRSGCESSVLGIIVFPSPPRSMFRASSSTCRYYWAIRLPSFPVSAAAAAASATAFLKIFLFFCQAVHVCVHVWVDGWGWWVRETARYVLSSQRNAINEDFKGSRFNEDYQWCEGRFCISPILRHMNHIFFFFT